MPEEAPTVAIDKLLLLQLPLGVTSDSVIVEAWQNAMLPVIAAGKGLTAITLVITQPVGAVSVIVVVPVATPVTIPLDRPMVAVPVLLLIHVPPEAASVSVEVAPMHTVDGPPIAGGIGLTVIVVVI